MLSCAQIRTNTFRSTMNTNIFEWCSQLNCFNSAEITRMDEFFTDYLLLDALSRASNLKSNSRLAPSFTSLQIHLAEYYSDWVKQSKMMATHNTNKDANKRWQKYTNLEWICFEGLFTSARGIFLRRTKFWVYMTSNFLLTYDKSVILGIRLTRKGTTSVPPVNWKWKVYEPNS